MARTLGEGIREGLANYQQLSSGNTANQLNKIKTLQAIKQMQAAEGASPAGYVRDPATGKLVKDINALNPLQASQKEYMDESRRVLSGGDSGPAVLGSQPNVLGGGMRKKLSFGPKGATVSYEDVSPLEEAKLNEIKRKEEEALKLKKDQEESLRNSAQDNLKTIEEVKKGAKYFGPMGEWPSEVSPSSLTGEYDQRKNWEANVNKLLSQKVLDVMTELKKTSKSGSTGFGALSEKELSLLQNASTALRRNLSQNDAMRYLNDIEAIHKKVLGGGDSNFNSPEEADASGLPPGSIVMVQGRKYQI